MHFTSRENRNMRWITFLGFMAVIGSCCAERVSWDDSDFANTRREILRWLKTARPAPRLKCSTKDHEASMSTLTQHIDSNQTKIILASLQNQMLASSDNFFVGISEALSSLHVNIAEVVFLSPKSHLSVYVYRNPLTGSKLFKICPGADCERNQEWKDPNSDDRYFFMISCIPFPTFVRKYFSAPPPVVTLFETNSFFESLAGVAGFFKKGFMLKHGKNMNRELFANWRENVEIHKAVTKS